MLKSCGEQEQTGAQKHDNGAEWEITLSPFCELPVGAQAGDHSDGDIPMACELSWPVGRGWWPTTTATTAGTIRVVASPGYTRRRDGARPVAGVLCR